MNIQLVIAGVIAAASFGTAWTVQEWRYGAKEADRDRQNYETVLESQRLAFRAKTESDQRVISAQNASVSRQKILRADADSSRAALIGLSQSAAEALSRAYDSHNACIVTANAQSVVLNQCGERYRSMAETADRHAIDSQTLIDAWPK